MGQLQLLLSYHAKNTSQIEFLTTLEMMEPSIAHLIRLLAEIFCYFVPPCQHWHQGKNGLPTLRIDSLDSFIFFNVR